MKKWTFRTHRLVDVEAMNKSVKKRRLMAKRGRVIGLLIWDDQSEESEVVLEKKFFDHDSVWEAFPALQGLDFLINHELGKFEKLLKDLGIVKDEL